jgi:hypothetical protein
MTPTGGEGPTIDPSGCDLRCHRSVRTLWSTAGITPWPRSSPAMLVERAAVLGLIDAEDVRPWIDTRLGRHSVPRIADDLGLPADLLRIRLWRADTRIAGAVTAGLLSGTVSPDTATGLSDKPARRDRIRAVKAAAQVL